MLIFGFGRLNIKWFILEGASVLMTAFLPIGNMTIVDHCRSRCFFYTGNYCQSCLLMFFENVTPRSVKVSDSHVIPRSWHIPSILSFNEPVQTALVCLILIFNSDIISYVD